MEICLVLRNILGKVVPNGSAQGHPFQKSLLTCLSKGSTLCCASKIRDKLDDMGIGINQIAINRAISSSSPLSNIEYQLAIRNIKNIYQNSNEFELHEGYM